MSRQLAFDLPARDLSGRADFLAAPSNAVALAALDRADWPGGRLLLVGPSGSGKTHLARLWAGETGAALLGPGDLAGADLPALAAAGGVALDDAAGVAGDPGAEAALFHLHNLLAGRGRLLLTARAPVRDWGLGLADLQSRMEAVDLARLEAPDDALLAGVMVKLFADRQVVVSQAVIPYLLARMERSVVAARALVAELDGRALARRGRVTRHLAAELMAERSAEQPAGPEPLDKPPGQ